MRRLIQNGALSGSVRKRRASTPSAMKTPITMKLCMEPVTEARSWARV
jgi:hypothetical protein